MYVINDQGLVKKTLKEEGTEKIFRNEVEISGFENRKPIILAIEIRMKMAIFI